MNQVYVIVYNGRHDTFVEAFSTREKMKERIKEMLEEASNEYGEEIKSVSNLYEYGDYISDYVTEVL